VSCAAWTVDSNSQVTISDNTTIDGTTLTNNGTIGWGAGDITLANSATIKNNYKFTDSANNDQMTQGGTFTNVGLFTADLSPAANSTISCDFKNVGGGAFQTPLVVQSGDLDIHGTASFSAPAAADTGTLEFSGGIGKAINSGTKFTGGGTLLVWGDVLHFTASATVQVDCNLELTRRTTLDGAAQLNVTNSFTWTDQSISDLTVNVTGSASLSTGGGAKGSDQCFPEPGWADGLGWRQHAVERLDHHQHRDVRDPDGLSRAELGDGLL
jgi:hypothetical protein